ncbi:MAG: HAD-IIIA family hydrolase [Eubacteriales bacterium]|nr:HAD-IIIA family hydrolase [Eubacteriales bacterium]
MKTVIMAGGKGTRISTVAGSIPKPMIKIDGKPILEHEIECLRSQGFTELIITISHMGHIIEDYFGDGSKFGVKIRYFKESVPLGNAGALIQLRKYLTEDFLLLNGDVIFDVDFVRMIDFHKKKGGYVTLFTHPNSHPYDSGLIVAKPDKSVLKWLTKEDERPLYYRNRVNGGIHIISPKVLDGLKLDPKKIGTRDSGTGKIITVDLDRQLLKPLAGTGKMFCYDSPEYVKDMGTPERLHSVTEDLKAGRVQAKNLKKLQKAVFLDRDGTLNRYVGFLRSPDEFELLDGVAEAIKRIHLKGYLCIVATNQPVIARGEVNFGRLEEIHNKMETLLGAEGVHIDGIYFCPHHPHKGFEGEVAELKIDCSCRKPKPGMLLQAAKDYHINLADSWMVGDAENDILAGRNAGCQTALIVTGEVKDYGQDRTVCSLLEFASKVIEK